MTAFGRAHLESALVLNYLPGRSCLGVGVFDLQRDDCPMPYVYLRNFKIGDVRFGPLVFGDSLSLLIFHRTNEIGEGRSCNDAIELGSVVVDYADVFDDQVVNFPLLVDAVEFVIDGHGRSLLGNELGVHFRIVLVFFLPRVNDILTGIGFNVIGIRSPHERGEDSDEFPLFLRAPAGPMSPERTFSHLLKVKPGINGGNQLSPLIDNLGFGFWIGTSDNGQHLVHGRAQLFRGVPAPASVSRKR